MPSLLSFVWKKLTSLSISCHWQIIKLSLYCNHVDWSYTSTSFRGYWKPGVPAPGFFFIRCSECPVNRALLFLEGKGSAAFLRPARAVDCDKKRSESRSGNRRKTGRNRGWKRELKAVRPADRKKTSRSGNYPGSGRSSAKDWETGPKKAAEEVMLPLHKKWHPQDKAEAPRAEKGGRRVSVTITQEMASSGQSRGSPADSQWPGVSSQ